MTLPQTDFYNVALASIRQPSRTERIRTESPESFATSLPKRIFEWLYSFSLIIFIILTAGFVVVTPLDIAVQTYGAPSTGIKMFIIMAACALFFVGLILLYFSRLYHSRDSVNQIPSKSVYVPLEENDLPNDVLKYIDDQLKKCLGDIKVRAGPLHSKALCFNYAGMSPPDYIQEHNVRMGYADQGTLFPPNCSYEDVIDSLALRQRFDGALLTNYSVPPSFTFREFMIYMYHRMGELLQQRQEMVLVVRKTIELYEKFRFGPDLICEHDLVVFLTSLEKFLSNFMLHDHLTIRRASNLDNALSYNWRGRQHSGIFDEDYRADIESLIVPYTPTAAMSRISTRQSMASVQSDSSIGSRMNPMHRSNTSGSVIKNRLEYRRLNRSFQHLGDTSEVSLRAPSGYLTDSEDDHDTIAT